MSSWNIGTVKGSFGRRFAKGSKRPTGVCPHCGFRRNLRKDGTLQRHELLTVVRYHSNGIGREIRSEECPGSGRVPKS